MSGGREEFSSKLWTKCWPQEAEESLDPAGLVCNSEMGPMETSTLVTFSGRARKLSLDAVNKMRLSTRAYYRVLKVATSVADLEGSPRVEEEHVAEALSYRQTVGLP